jgi:D-alanyl-D-alanine carboxypeptidase (penicillin-binding protein 5/6)
MTRLGYDRLILLLTALLLALAAGRFARAQAPSAPVPPAAFSQPRVFDVDSPIAILMETSTGQVLIEKNADQPHPPASIAKVMTMLLVMEAIDRGDIHLDDLVTVSERASKIGGSQAYLKEGETMSVDDLLKAVAIHSANDACVALAEQISGAMEAFVDSMNDKARDLGMKNTVVHTPHRLPPDPGQQPDMTTARDITIMARALILKHPMILKYTGTVHDTLRGGAFRLDNTNKLVGRFAGVDGLKTGYFNKAGFGLAATASRNGLRLISVVLGARSNSQRAADSARLLNYGFASLRNYLALKKGKDLGEVPVRKGRVEKVAARAGEDLRVLLRRGDERRLTLALRPLPALSAPLAAGQKIGSVVVLLDGKALGQATAVAETSVEKANLIIRFFRWLFALLGIH